MTSQQAVLVAGQKCPSCGKVTIAPLHACHVIRDNYVVVLEKP